MAKRAKDRVIRKQLRAERKARKAALEAKDAAGAGAAPSAEPAPAAQSSAAAPVAPAKDTPVAFLFPGQGSQAVGMLQVRDTPQACCCQASRVPCMLQ